MIHYNVKVDMSTKWDDNSANDDRSNDVGFLNYS